MKGRCCCGVTQFEMTEKPLIVHCCHCTWCQRESGAAFAVNAFIETAHVRLLSGETEAVDIPSASGKGQRVHRCPSCKTSLWGQYLGLGNSFSFVKVGTLENPDKCPPDIHIFTESKLPWVVLPADMPAMDKYYNRVKYWSDNALARFQAVMDA